MHEKIKSFFVAFGALCISVISFLLGRKLYDNRDRDTTNRDAINKLGDASDRIEESTRTIRDILEEVRKRKVED